MTSDRPMALGPRYWGALSVASVFGATGGDVLSHDGGLGHWRGVPVLLLLSWTVVRAGRRGPLNRELAYWTVVVLVRAMATNVADLAIHDAHLRQPALLALLVGWMLAAASWPVRAGNAGGAAPGLPDTRGGYWPALLGAGTLGTMLGDDASYRFGLPVASAGLGAMLGVTLLLRGCARNRARGPAAVPAFVKIGYWTTVTVARTAGTSVGDLLADRGGLGLAGSALAEGALLAATLLVWPRPGRLPAGSTATNGMREGRVPGTIGHLDER